MTIKRFSEYLASGIVKKRTPDLERAESLRMEAKKKKEFIELVISKIPEKQLSPNFIVDSSYDILIEMIRAKMLIDGYNTDNSHEAEVSYLEKLGFSEVDIRLMDELRYYRNGIKYYGKVMDLEYAQKMLEFMEKMSGKLWKLY